MKTPFGIKEAVARTARKRLHKESATLLIIRILKKGKTGLQREMDCFFWETEVAFLNLPDRASISEEFGTRGMGRGRIRGK